MFFSPFSFAITSLREEIELILVLFVPLFDLCLFGFVGFLFLLVSGKGCGFWLFYEAFVVCLSVCHFVLVFFGLFSIAIISLGEERADLSAFRTFVRFVLV